MGVCSAFALAERQRQVVVLDKDRIGSGCSYGNAGFIAPSHSIPLAAPGVPLKGLKWMLNPESPFYIKPRLDWALWTWLWKFCAACRKERAHKAVPVLRDLHRASVAEFDRLTGLPGMTCGYTKRGLLMVYRTRSGYEEGLKEAGVLTEAGLRSQALDAREVLAIAPQVRDGVAGGLHFLEDAHLNPAEFVQGLARQAEQKGVIFAPGAEVIGVERAGARVSLVRTTQGEYRPDTVVLAAGAWSPDLAHDLKVRLPIQPAKGYSITVRKPASWPSLPLILSERHVGVTPMGPLLRFAGTLELAGLDFSITQRRVKAMRRAAAEYLEGVEDLEELEVWRGMRPCTPDGLPVIGRSRELENLILATGHAMIGISLGPITGVLVAQLACHEKTMLDLAPLAPERF